MQLGTPPKPFYIDWKMVKLVCNLLPLKSQFLMVEWQAFVQLFNVYIMSHLRSLYFSLFCMVLSLIKHIESSLYMQEISFVLISFTGTFSKLILLVFRVKPQLSSLLLTRGRIHKDSWS